VSLKYFHLLLVLLSSLVCGGISAKATVALTIQAGGMTAAYAIGGLALGIVLILYGVRYALRVKDVGFIG
jgi:hypothetical protein